MHSKDVKEALKSLLNDVAQYVKERHDEEVCSWLMAATFRIWSANKLFSEDYLAVLPVFKEQEYTAAQVITALDCAGDEDRELDIPAFFREIVEKDKIAHTSESRNMVDSVGRFLVLVALVNGDFTLEEAGALHGICDLLLGYCDHQGVVAGKTWGSHPEMITPLNKTSYHQQSPAEKKEAERKNDAASEQVNPIPSSNNPPATKAEEPIPTITLNLNLVPEQSAEDKVVDVPASGVTVKKPLIADEPTDETLDIVRL